jgi:hypothetical protein
MDTAEIILCIYSPANHPRLPRTLNRERAASSTNNVGKTRYAHEKE